ncbi:hypothetical protein CROQUDRAFT_674957 [Cronartium quercuum f. sp. fusiforme G11]|uniref:Uncharacterized protein n=1 Tax=Cronartium quercuum f. sp. fusiforme G11 TaxID=708437 RepID=A0A9P6N5N4_9BASI|nr:hypothetical protein CROQUDRAFT_674957 [Cronartium quercuum f. sp. fusiforme G11]
MFLLHLPVLVSIVGLASLVTSSSHSVNLVNNCGTPTTMQLPGRGNYGAGNYNFDGDIKGGIAQACSDINGVGCTSIEFSLVDGISSADITLISPHNFDHPATFTLNNNEIHATCSNANCGTDNAFFKSDDYTAQRQVNGASSSIYMQFC